MPIAKERRTLIVISLGTAQTLAWGSTYYLPAILAAPMADTFGVSTGFVYGVFSIAMLITAFFGPGVGQRIDRFGGRGVLTTSSLVFALGLILLGASPNLVVFVIGWLAIGLGMAMGLYEAGFATLTAIYGKDARSAITGITLLAGFASTICWPISTIVEAEWGWRVACYVWAAAHLLIGLPINRLLIPKTESQASVSAPSASSEAPSNPDTSMFSRPMILLGISFAAMWITSTALAAHLPRILEAAGATKTVAVAAASLVGPAQVAARILEHSVLQRYHPLLSARLATITHPIGFAMLLIFGPAAAYVFTILHGSGNGVISIAKGTLPLAIFGPIGYGRRQGYLAAPSRFGQAAAPFVFALLLEQYGHYVLLFTSGLCVISLAALMLLRNTNEQAS